MNFAFLLIRICAFSILLAATKGVRMRRKTITLYVLQGDNVTLTCDYNLEGQELYSLLWWREGSVLLKYFPQKGSIEGNWPSVSSKEEFLFENATMPFEQTQKNQPITVYDFSGVNILLNYALIDTSPEDAAKSMLILSVTPAASGNYICEVTEDSIAFQTANTTYALHVIVPPKSTPLLTGTSGPVADGQIVEAKCHSSPAAPPPDVTFFVNGNPVVARFMTAMFTSKTPGGMAIVSRGVSFRAYHQLFEEGYLKLECRVNISSLTWSRYLNITLNVSTSNIVASSFVIIVEFAVILLSY